MPKFDYSSFYDKAKALSITVQHFDSVEKYNLSHLTKVVIRSDAAARAYEWAETRLANDWVWGDPMFSPYTALYFKYPEDAAAFKLAFSDFVVVNNTQF